MNGTHHIVALLCLLGLGAAVGSFLNVCIYRLPLGMSVLHPPSRCPSCGRGVAWKENIPIAGWLALRGRCRGCGWRIPVRYPAVELLTGLWFAAAWAVVAASCGGDILEGHAAAALGGMLALQAAGCAAIVGGGMAYDAGRQGRQNRPRER
jgi:prepilin signal peptidase PulO-like enzyme (type II secretory pathway)